MTSLKGETRMINLQHNVDMDLLERMNQYKAQTGQPRTETIRVAVREYLDRMLTQQDQETTNA